MMTKRTVLMLALVARAMVPAVAFADPPPAADIVAAADKIKNPLQPFRVTLALTEYVRGKPHESVGLNVHAKADPSTHQYRNLVSYVGPPRDVGKLVLLTAGNLWFYDPASKASIRISPQQRLTGQASDGDVLTANLARDYGSTVVGEESIQDADHRPRTVWHLDLKAASRDAAYQRIEYWVETDTSRPIKSKFYSDSGRLLKIAYYRGYEEHLGASRPMETIIIDAVDANLVTTIKYSDYRAEDVQDSWFQREFLPRFTEQ